MTRTKRRQTQPYQIKGVDALFGDSEPKSQSVGQLSLEQIQLPASQPRRYFDLERLEQLTESIKEHGILEPLLVRSISSDRYELVAGERRYRASALAGLKEVPVIIKELSDTEALQLSLIENLQREDLNPVEETEGILQLLALKLETDASEVVSLLYRMQNWQAGKITDNVISNSKIEVVQAVFTGVGRMNWESFTANRLPLLRLPEDILEALRSGKIEYTKARALASVKDESARAHLLSDTIERSLSLSQIRERIKSSPITISPQFSAQEQDIFTRLDTTYKQVKKAKKLLLEDVKKQKKLESLLGQIEKLFLE
jgi:ParB family transcriptional regulator, chromosome partitioning protein